MPWLTDLADALRAGGCRVVENGGWRTRGHGDMSGVRGVLCHHTAGGGSNDWQIVQNGRPGLAGPLAHMTLERDGTFRLIAAGQAWHAGTGSHPAVGTNNGNAWLIGIEGASRGVGNDWTAAQRDAYPRGVAALLRHYRLGADRAIFHREWAPRRKIDPQGFDGPTFRGDVARLLAGGPQPPPPPLTRKVPDMIDRPLVKGSNTGTVIVPTGTASAIVAEAWVSVRTDGGGRVQVWFQKSADSDGAAPGTGTPLDKTYKNAARPWAAIPSGTEYIQYSVDANGPGALTIELKAK